MATQVQRRRGTSEQYATNAFKGAVGEFTYDETLMTVRVHDGSTVGGHIVMTYDTPISPGVGCKITYDSQGRVTGSDVLSWSDVENAVSDKFAPKLGTNGSATTETACKVTYNSDGLVVSGTALSNSDIPSGISQAKISGLTDALAEKMPQIPVSSTATGVGSVTLTNHAVNKVTMTGSVTLVPPTVTNHQILNQLVAEVYKSNPSWTVGLSATHYFGTDSAPSTADAGVYNIYYEYSEALNAWVVGAIKKI